MSRIEPHGFIQQLENERSSRREAMANLKTEVVMNINAVAATMLDRFQGVVSKDDLERSLLVVEKLTKRLEEESFARKSEFASLSKNVQDMLAVGWVKFKDELASVQPGSIRIESAENGSGKKANDDPGYKKLRQTVEKMVEEVASLKSQKAAATPAKSKELDIMSTNMATFGDVLARLQGQVDSMQTELSALTAEVKKMQLASTSCGNPGSVQLASAPGDNAASVRAKVLTSSDNEERPAFIRTKMASSIPFGPPINAARREVTIPQPQASYVEDVSAARIAAAPYPRTPRVREEGSSSQGARARSPSHESVAMWRSDATSSTRRMVSANVPTIRTVQTYDDSRARSQSRDARFSVGMESFQSRSLSDISSPAYTSRGMLPVGSSPMLSPRFSRASISVPINGGLSQASLSSVPMPSVEERKPMPSMSLSAIPGL